MTEIPRKQDDTTPFTGNLQANGSNDDLSQATEVKFFMKPEVDAEPKAAGVGTIVDVDTAKVRYQFDATEVDEVGTFLAEWQVEWADGTFQTYPNTDYLRIDIRADLSD